MHIELIDPVNIAAFIDHCRSYGREMDKSYLSAENDTAAALYFNDGFSKVQAVVCYQYEIK